MTLQQLKYVVTVADKGSINDAAKSLFIAQPSLSTAVRELEGELGRTLFVRTSRGIALTADGAEFLGYARQVLQQTDLLEEKYLSGKPARQRFRVSAQHYAFTASAFVELVREFGGSEYEFTLRETGTLEVIEDVKLLRSELGVIYLSGYNEAVIGRLLQESAIGFHPLLTVRPHVFLARGHPLAGRTSVSLDELEAYPCLTMEQGPDSSFYFAEEILAARSVRKSIRVSDRAALVNFMIGLNAYNIATGIYPKPIHGEEIVAVPLDVEEQITVGVLKHRDMRPTRLGEIYWAALRKIAGEYGAEPV